MFLPNLSIHNYSSNLYSIPKSPKEKTAGGWADVLVGEDAKFLSPAQLEIC
jgi:hypothetical protein